MGTSREDENGTLDFWRDWDLSNLTEIEYLNKVLGARYLPLSLVIPLTIAYLLIFVAGVFGNVATCTVIVRNSSMQTATNYYLFSLAISDLTLLMLGLPNELSLFWQQYPWALGVGLCKIRAYVSEMSSYVSVLTIVAFSMERYLAICHPLRVYSMSGLKRPTRFIFAAWSIAMISAIPFAIYTKVNFVEYPPGMVVIMFFLCWGPFHAQRLLYIYAQDSDYYPDLNEWLYILSGCLYYFSTTVNPILYNLMSMRYRQAFKQTICCRTKRPTNKILMDKGSHLRRRDSANKVHDRSVMCSIRHSIAQVKEIFCFTPSRQENAKDRNSENTSSFPQNACLLQKEESSSAFLFERGHLLARQQPSNESTSTKRSEDMISVAKTSL
ncbi:neuropeptides capa receptor-like protein [Lasius niger]|uniref:Neuropeptides capa receptor-like protein n=1 Tax=Lasius niger TaxID=67767 RepID=A0A0J7NTU3_LASNI|nr:neuropeptides capa receptor-like protein [Lasius niger]